MALTDEQMEIVGMNSNWALELNQQHAERVRMFHRIMSRYSREVSITRLIDMEGPETIDAGKGPGVPEAGVEAASADAASSSGGVPVMSKFDPQRQR